MEQFLDENVYVIDLGEVNTAPEIIFQLSSVLDKEEAKNRRVCLKLGHVDLNQAQLLSIKSLINGIDSTLSSIDTKSIETEKVALSLGIIVSNVSAENTTEVAPAMPYKMAEELKEEVVIEQQESPVENYDIVEEVEETSEEQTQETTQEIEVQGEVVEEPIQNEEIIILGAGGVGRAVAFMCAVNGASKVYLLNRTIKKAEQIAQEVNKKVGTNCVEAWCMEDYTQLPDKKYLVLQATSVGLHPNDEDVVLEDEAFYKKVKAGYDLIYNPWETKFMKLVKAQGGLAYNGLKMLLFQAIDAFELWNQCKVPDECAKKAYELLQQAVKKS